MNIFEKYKKYIIIFVVFFLLISFIISKIINNYLEKKIDSEKNINNRLNILETFKTEDNYTKFLRNKNVIIVGPAEHVNSGKFIDSHDVVVRLNRGLKLCEKPEKYGSKTNVMYFADHHSYDGLTKEDLKKLDFIKFQFPDADNKDYFYPLGPKEYEGYNTIPFSNTILRADKSYLDFEKEIKTRPNTGTFAIWDILRYPIKSLYITGITLNTSNYNEDYYKTIKNFDIKKVKNDKIHGTHNLSNMARYYNTLLKNNKVSYDDNFKKSIKILI
tara:strand:+ start:2686 stop:3504 length:819 start_codon:yes stop_codon:yes gene_type:complete